MVGEIFLLMGELVARCCCDKPPAMNGRAAEPRRMNPAEAPLMGRSYVAWRLIAGWQWMQVSFPRPFMAEGIWMPASAGMPS